ncbi:MAG: hypothetical protein AAF664_09290 [Planctomycetota bacterium]
MRRLSKGIRFVLAVYAVCFVGGSLNHARDIWVNGIFPHSSRPVFCHVFWTLLTFIDPIVPVLFWLRWIKTGVTLAATIMLLDVGINTWYSISYRESIYSGNVDLIAQTAFLAFVLGTCPVIWAASSRDSSDLNA